MELQARQRLIAFGTNSIGKKGIDSKLYDAISEMSDVATSFRKIGTEKGVTLWLKDDLVFASVPDCWAPVGIMETWKNEAGYREVDFSVVDSKFLGRGIGTVMYELLIKEFGHLASSNDLSKGSSALWQRLVTKYKGWLVIPEDNSPTGKEYRVRVVDWTKKGGITYPIVETPKGRRDLKNLSTTGRDSDSQAAAYYAYYLVES